MNEDELFDDLAEVVQNSSVAQAWGNGGGMQQNPITPTGSAQTPDPDATIDMGPKSDIEIEDDNLDPDAGINVKAGDVAGILGLDSKATEITRSDYSIKSLEVDIDLYEDMYDMSQVMQDSVEAGKNILDVFDKLNADIFLSLFKYKPVLISESKMKKSTKINNRLMKKLVDTPEYRRLRQTCKLDVFCSALGTEIIGKKAIEILLEAKEQAEQLAQANGGKGDPFAKANQLAQQDELIDELEEQVENLDELIEESKQQNGGNVDPSLQAQSDSARLSLAQAKQIAEQMADELDDELELADDILEEATQKIVTTFTEADEQVCEISDTIDMWGFNPGDGVRVSMQGKREAVERLRKSPKLKDLSKLIGRFKETAMRDQKQKTKLGASSIKTVTTGNDILKVLPSEKMGLAHKATKSDFYRKYNQKELLTYEMENTNKKNKGPMIVCDDTSGSMSGGREKWSKAVMIALLEVAKEQKRNFAGILYDSAIDMVKVIEKDELNPNDVLDLAERFSGGGTDFEAPLNKCLELIKESKFKKADIVFITDGDCGISDSFLKKFKQIKEEKEFNCIGIIINAGGYGSSDATLKEFCDQVIPVSNLADLTNSESEVAHKIFSGV